MVLTAQYPTLCTSAAGALYAEKRASKSASAGSRACMHRLIAQAGNPTSLLRQPLATIGSILGLSDTFAGSTACRQPSNKCASKEGIAAEPQGSGFAMDLQHSAWFASQSLEVFPVQEAACVLGLACLFPILRWLLELIVYMPTARWLMVPARTYKTGVLPDKLTRRMRKFAEAQWKLTCYGTFTAIGILATYKQPWLWDTRQCWYGWPHQQMTAPMRWLYALETAYYLATTVMLAVWEVPRKDFHVMMTHHFATVVSIIFTYKYNYTRIGVVVMLLHDVNDVLMELAKSFNYLHMDAAATSVFAVFVATWAALRIYAFPAYCVKSSLLYSWEILGFRPPCHGLLNGLLMALYCIHIYWFSLILRIAWRKLSTGKTQDIREEADDDSDSD